MATAADCGHDWCVAPHEPMCDCPFSNAQPHVAAGCRYAPEIVETSQRSDVAVTKRTGKPAGQERGR